MASRAPTSGIKSIQLQSDSRNHIAIFVRCLHLLDLDLLEDWPGVDEKLFTAKAAQQSLQQRVKAVEWSLYRLFELYDPSEAKDKLRPFFPPVSQLQSVNLRAALYRFLTELKKIGVIGKDAVLRKTMLDDCKGERFEEVLAGFAMTVLRKKTALSGNVGNTYVSDNELTSIILAYRVSLCNRLEDRKNTRVEARHQSTLLDAAETRLGARLERCKAASTALNPAKRKQIQTAVNGNWIGDSTWADVLLQGVPQKLAFEDKSVTTTALPTKNSQELLDKLDARIRKHQDRLSEWKALDRELASKQKQRDALEVSKSQPKANETGPIVHFSSHQELKISNWQVKVPKQFPQAGSYERLLRAMQQELADLSTPTRRSTAGRVETHDLDSSSPAMDSAPVVLRVSQTISGQQQPPAGEPYIATSPLSNTSSDGVSTADDHLERSISPSPMQSSNESTPWKPYQQSSATTIDGDAATSVKDSAPPTSNAPEPPMSPSTLWLSLAERTRASMSLSNHHKSLSDPESPVKYDFEGTPNYSHPEPSVPHENHQATLLERTRKSMSTFSNSSASRSRKVKPEKRTSQIFPVNQFETPGRPQRIVDLAPSSGASTPRDELFDQDAEYASVFKSRPKLAMSPTFSPDRGTSELDSILEHDMERLNLDSDQEIG